MIVCPLEGLILKCKASCTLLTTQAERLCYTKEYRKQQHVLRQTRGAPSFYALILQIPCFIYCVAMGLGGCSSL